MCIRVCGVLTLTICNAMICITVQGRKEGRKVGEGSGCPCLWVLSPSPSGRIEGGVEGVN